MYFSYCLCYYFHYRQSKVLPMKYFGEFESLLLDRKQTTEEIVQKQSEKEQERTATLSEFLEAIEQKKKKKRLT